MTVNEALEQVFDIILNILIWAFGIIILGTLAIWLFQVNASENAVHAHDSTESEIIYSCKYNSDISDAALDALCYSSKKGFVDGGMRASTVDCFRYVGNNVTLVDVYNNSAGYIRVVTADKSTLYLIVEESDCSYVQSSSSSYDEYRKR